MLVHVACLIFSMKAAPRKAEGMRLVVDLPWTEYAWSAVMAPLALTLIAGLLIARGRRGRVAFTISATGAAWLFWMGFGFLNLLRRDYIGKL